MPHYYQTQNDRQQIISKMKLTLQPKPIKPCFMQTTQPVAEQLRRLLNARNTTIKAIASAANVDYQALRRWFVGASEKLDVTLAEKVYKHLTGRGFTDER